MPQPCRICQTQTAAEFCSPECYEEHEAATKPCPACHRPGWDCYCDDAYTITATEQCEDRPCPNCGELDYPCRCGRDEMIEHQFDDLPAGDYYDDGYDDIYDDGRFDIEDCPW
jgi:hypothetical protein